ncbi:hypothetical protein FKW77_001729 [Venturia effusa]|uniref:HIT-type domain-containing protein n=1 Tax=Venturia effusa TaxID=50376 RepID=A0A517LD88_9PEZI|nr:hypothetical protein FKW77_001729 [Venturia effusa]
MSSTLCGVCKTDASKYKCPHCQVPYCSVKCFKVHILDHESDTKPSSPTDGAATAQDDSNAPTEQRRFILDSQGSNVKESFTDDSAPANPYESLVHHPQFQSLFTKYPLLKRQLARVHNATNNPADITPEERVDQRVNGNGNGRNHQQGDRVKGQWTQEKANELAAEILVSLMEKEEGVREFMALRRIVLEPVEKGDDVVGENEVNVDINGV